MKYRGRSILYALAGRLQSKIAMMFLWTIVFGFVTWTHEQECCTTKLKCIVVVSCTVSRKVYAIALAV